MPTYSLNFNGDAVQIFERIKNQLHPFFLDSSLKRDGQGRCSYLGCSPFKVLKGRGFAQLRKALNPYINKKKIGRAVGYISYDGDFFFGLYDAFIEVDHARKVSRIYAPHRQKAEQLKKLLFVEPPSKTQLPSLVPRQFKSNFTKQAYVTMIRRALEHIHQGDIYQINLSHKITVPINKNTHLDPSKVYAAMRRLSPSSFSAYFYDGHQHILSTSPERFLTLDKGVVLVRPMKGTRPRGRTPKEDKHLEQELLKSPKEIAELLMVTDLERNDLGRVCAFGTVKVKSMRTIERYKNVFQATSTVEGRLREGLGPMDVLEATFPSGSVSGCPKIEAMRLIKQLEQTPRGLYTGALGYIDFSGKMDFNVLIRTMVINSKEICFHVGGGIVADSNPEAEYEETWVKAGTLMEALKEVV